MTAGAEPPCCDKVNADLGREAAARGTRQNEGGCLRLDPVLRRGGGGGMSRPPLRFLGSLSIVVLRGDARLSLRERTWTVVRHGFVERSGRGRVGCA